MRETGQDALAERRQQAYAYAEIIFDSFDDGIYITDEQAVTLYLNHSYERISGLTWAEMVGRNMRELVDSQVISMSGTLAALASGDTVTIEQSFRTGKRAIITSIPIYDREPGRTDPGGPKTDAGELLMVLTVVRETTELYQIKKELQKKEKQNRTYVRQLERTAVPAPGIPAGFSLKDSVARMEASWIDLAYKKYGNVRDAAAALGIDSSTFVRKRQRYEQMGLLQPREAGRPDS